MVVLDSKDRQLLYELDCNARAPLARIAKKIKVSKEVARYRLKAIEKTGAIMTYFAIIDISKLGYAIQKAFIKLKNASEKDEAKLIGWLVGNENVLWVVSCDGQFDLAFGMRALTVENYMNQLAELDNKFGHLFLERQIAPIVRGRYFHRDYLIGGHWAPGREYAFGSVPNPASLDEHDWGILEALGKNGRTPITEIANTLKLSPDVVSKRLKKIERMGVIKNYILVLNNAALNQIHYKVLMRLKSITDDRYNALLSFCEQDPNTFYAVRTFGPWEFEIDLEVSDVQSFRKIMRELKGKFSDIISDYSYISIYKIHKYNFCPSKPK